MAFGPELVYAWSAALSRLTGRRVQKAEGCGDSVFISLSGGAVLLISWGSQNCGAAIVTEAEKKSLLSITAQTPPITNAIKSHIAGATLVSVEQLRRDRLLRFTFRKTLGAGFTNSRSITLEAMERYGNLVLTDGDECVIEAAKHIYPADNSFRSVLPRIPYVLPPEFNGISLEQWLASPSADTTDRIAGFGRPFIKALAGMETETAAKYISQFYITDKYCNMIPQRIGKYITVFPVLLDGAEQFDGTAEETGRAVVLSPIVGRGSEAIRRKIVQHLKKEVTRRERQTADIERLLYEDDPAKFKRFGELIIANMWNIKHGEASAELSTWNNAGEEVRERVELDPSLSPSQNAERYFAKYKKITAAQERAAKLLGKVTAEMEDLREEMSMAMCLDDAESLTMMENELGLHKAPVQGRKKKAEPPKPPHKRIDLGFALVLAGLSSKGNHYVTFRAALPDDIWFHAQNVPGSHVILRFNETPDDELRDAAVRFCASLAAHYSKGRENASQRVDYTTKKHVSPIRGGEANVTYKEFSSIAAEKGLWERYLSEIQQAQREEAL